MKYEVFIISRELNSIHVIKRIKITSTTTKINFKNHTYMINLNNVCFIFKNTNFYLIDYETSNQFSLFENKQLLNASELDSIVSQQFLSEMMKSVNENKLSLGQKIVFFAFGALTSIVIALALVNSQLSNAITNISDISSHFIQV